MSPSHQRVAGAEHDSCEHGDLPPVFARLGSPGDDDDFCFDVVMLVAA
jgi:hypothetical protein